MCLSEKAVAEIGAMWHYRVWMGRSEVIMVNSQRGESVKSWAGVLEILKSKFLDLSEIISQ